jgi:hypothetical protein
MPDPTLEHLGQHVARPAVLGGRVGRRGHRRRDRGVPAHPLGDHGPHIAVGEDPEAIPAEVDHDRRPRAGSHQGGRLADGGLRPAHRRLAAHQAAHRLIGGVDRWLARQHVQLRRLLQQRPGDEAHPFGP